MDEMMRVINKYSNGTYLKVEWGSGELVLEGEIDTIYESNNGLDEENVGYKEFYACAFRIKNIINNINNIEYHVGDLIEISVENEPALIVLNDGSVGWEKSC